jgi:aspartate racemase
MSSIRIGILGGMSYESTIKYYAQILEKYYQKKQDYAYPEVVIFSLNFQRVIDLEHGNNKVEYIDYLMEGIESLEKAGANFILMAANSPHAVYEDLIQLAKVPILSIVEATAEKAQQEKLNKLLLLGIKYTMQSSFYQEFFAKLNMRITTPSEPEQDTINQIIFDELVLLRIISNYEVDGVILGCTELPLILQQKDTNIKLLDTVEVHVEAALKYYLIKSKIFSNSKL